MKQNEIMLDTVQQFAEEAVGQIKKYLPEEHQNIEYHVIKIQKNNGVNVVGACFEKAGDMVGINLNMESYFEDYKQGVSCDKIMKSIASHVREAFDTKPAILVEQMRDFNSVRSSIEPVLVNTKANLLMLEDTPHIRIEDLSVICRIAVPFQKGEGSITINNEYLSYWGIRKEQLFTQAFENCQKPETYVLQSLTSAVEGIFELEQAEETCIDTPKEEPRIPRNILEIASIDMWETDVRESLQNEFYEIGTSEIYVLSNQNRMYGAAAVLSPQVMEKVDRLFPEGFYVLPSSIHECIIVPKIEDIGLKEFKEMVREINRAVVQPEEVLSDNVYEYDRERGRIRQAVDSMERGKEMER